MGSFTGEFCQTFCGKDYTSSLQALSEDINRENTF